MKKKWLIPLCLLLLLAAVVFLILDSPEYALFRMVLQVQEEGFEAIIPCLTHDAYQKISPLLKVSENKIVQSILVLLPTEEYAGTLIEKAKEVEWTVGEFAKNRERATVTIGFNYQSSIIGSVDLELRRVSRNWMIHDLSNLKIDKLH